MENRKVIAMPKVSIIMGVYNCAHVVGKAIESIQEQSFTDWEFIICDDCSTDATFTVVKEYADLDSRIILIKNNTNSRLAFSLNHCLSIAKGQYIARMDGDDIALPDRLAKQVDFLDKNLAYNVVGGGIILFDEEGDKRLLLNKEVPSVEDMKRRIPFFHPTIMMRKSAYDKLDGYLVSKRTLRGQDLDLWFRFYANGFSGYNLQEPVLKYHDDIGDYAKKSSFKVSWGLTKTMLSGFKANKFPFYSYIWAFVPIITACIPRFIVYFIHNKKN